MKTCYTLKVDNTHIAIADLVRPGELTTSWTITRINVPRNSRGNGIGSALLKQIIRDADADQVSLQLEVFPSDGLTYSQLAAWYNRYGFRMTASGYMRRYPSEFVRPARPNRTLELMRAALKSLKDFENLRDVNSPTFDLGLQTLEKAIEMEIRNNRD